jgi:hypothetical protein
MKRQGWGEAESQETEGEEHGTHGHHEATAMRLDDASNAGSDHTRRQ